MHEHDLLSMKEFSALTGIKQSTLRYYDEIQLFQPIYRNANGYRYYSAPQAIAVQLIQVMNNLGIPLKKICVIQKERTPERMLALLHSQACLLNQELFRLQQAYAIIHAYCGIIREGLAADEHAITLQRMGSVPIELGPVNDFSSGNFYDSFFRYTRQMASHGVNAAYPAGGFYRDMGAFLSTPGQPSRYFSLIPTGQDATEAGDYLVGYTRGYYGHLGDLPRRLQAFADEQGYAFVGPVYELYLHDEVSIVDPDQYLIQASVRANKRQG